MRRGEGETDAHTYAVSSSRRCLGLIWRVERPIPERQSRSNAEAAIVYTAAAEFYDRHVSLWQRFVAPYAAVQQDVCIKKAAPIGRTNRPVQLAVTSAAE